MALGDLVVELAQPLGSDSMIADDMERHHQSLYAVHFKCGILEAARQHLEKRGITFSLRDENTLLTDPATTHGAVFGFTTWKIPNDLRPRH